VGQREPHAGRPRNLTVSKRSATQSNDAGHNDRAEGLLSPNNTLSVQYMRCVARLRT